MNQHRAEQWDVGIGRANGGNSHLLNTDVDEPGWLGNPFPLSEGYSREKSISRYREAFRERLQTDAFRVAVNSLQGKTLACYCRPKACHGDVILEYLGRGRSVFGLQIGRRRPLFADSKLSSGICHLIFVFFRWIHIDCRYDREYGGEYYRQRSNRSR